MKQQQEQQQNSGLTFYVFPLIPSRWKKKKTLCWLSTPSVIFKFAVLFAFIMVHFMAKLLYYIIVYEVKCNVPFLLYVFIRMAYGMLSISPFLSFHSHFSISLFACKQSLFHISSFYSLFFPFIHSFILCMLLLLLFFLRFFCCYILLEFIIVIISHCSIIVSIVYNCCCSCWRHCW